MVACAVLAPVRADEAAKPASPMAGQGQAASDSQTKAPINGEQLFAGTCGFCHEAGGRKAGRGPKLAGTERSDEFIINRITNGKSGKMPAFGHVYSQEQIKQILAYIRSLKP
jgi:mono/diheme cytochrome c family protein